MFRGVCPCQVQNPPLLLAQEICYNANDLNQKEGILLRRGICPRVSGGKKFSPLSFIRSCNMEAKRTLSVFVDESGRFQHPDPDSRFYIIGMVFHDQSDDIA